VSGPLSRKRVEELKEIQAAARPAKEVRRLPNSREELMEISLAVTAKGEHAGDISGSRRPAGRGVDESMIKPQPSLKEVLADAIVMLRGMADGSLPVTIAALDTPFRAYAAGKRMAKRRQFRNADHPLHGQIAQIEAILAEDERLRGLWELEEPWERKEAEDRHKPLWKRGWAY
jgi:hypothetical protein